MTTPALALDRVGQIALTISDLDRAVAFYRDALGVPFLFTAPPGLALFRAGELSIMLSRPEGEFHAGQSSGVVYFQVDDIASAHATLQSRGVSFIDAPHLVHRAADFELWMAFFKDPDGNPLAIMARKAVDRG